MYQFTAANEGEVKFENAVVFQTEGKQDVYVYDLNDDSKLGLAEVTVTKEKTENNVDIEILSPENGVTLGKNTVSVSGQTKKNHQVKLVINKKEELFTTSNESGVFEKEVEKLKEWENTIEAMVLNAENKVIGEAKKVQVKISATAPEFKSLTLTPSGEVEPETKIIMELVSNANLSEVRVIINDVITELKEGKSGVYSWSTLAPKELGEYDVNITLKDEFAIETSEKWVDTLVVIAPLESAEPEKKVVETIEDTPKALPAENLELTISDIKVTELKTKSIITWKELADAESYNVYKKISNKEIELVENTKIPRFEVEITGDEIKYDEFAIKALGKTSTGQLVQGDLSEMTKVKTGPELYIMMALLALLLTGGIFFLKRRA